MLSRIAHWWLARHEPLPPDPVEPEYWNPVGECICGRQVAGDEWHIIVAVGDDDNALGIEGGGTAMSADFCADHCPGGCRQGCPVVEPRR